MESNGASMETFSDEEERDNATSSDQSGSDTENDENRPKIVPSNNGKRSKLMMDGFTYNFDREVEHTTYWKCTKYSQSRCKGRVITNRGKVTKVTDNHSHPPNMNGVLKACFIDNLKKAAISKSNVSRKAIVSSEYRKAEHLLSMTTVPTSKSLLELVTRKRKKESSFGFSSLQQLEIPRELQMFTTSEYFMLYDSGPSADRVIVFGSRRCAEIMEKSEHLFIDGTFDAAPSLFYQMVSIHAKIGEIFCPVLFALTAKKNVEAYIKILEVVKTAHGINVLPPYITVDFEQAIHAAIRAIFPDATIYGCLYHYRMAIFRSAQRLNLQSRYQRDPEFHRYISMVACLAFVPVDHVRAVYTTLTGEGIFINQHDKDYRGIQSFLEYFERTWIGRETADGRRRRVRSKYNVSLWNIHQRVLDGMPTTNNAVEGWHNGLRSNLRKSPSFGDLIEFLKDESVFSAQKVREYEESGISRSQSAATKRSQITIQRIVKNFNRYDNKIDYLKDISKSIQL